MAKARKPVQRAAATRKDRAFLTFNANDNARAVLEADAERRVAHTAWSTARQAAKKRAQRDEADRAWDVAREAFQGRVFPIVVRIYKRRRVQGGDILALALAAELGSVPGAEDALRKTILRKAGGMRMSRKRSGATYIPRR
jgi:hypothetical protein